MNKIYKLIWSKTKNCWVVASELAKGHGKNKSRREGKSLLAVAVMTALLGGAFLPAGMVSAADGAAHYVNVAVNTGKTIEARKYPGEAIEESAVDPDANYDLSANPAINAISIGAEASAWNNGAVAMGFKTIAKGEYATALGTGSAAYSKGDLALGWKAYTDWNQPNKIAIGTESTALKENGISIGTKSKTWYDNAIAIGNEAETGNKGGVTSNDSIAIGNKAKIQGQKNVAIGSEVTVGTGSTSSGSSYVVAIGSDSHAYDTDSVVIGGHSEVHENAVVVGNRSKAGMESVAVGSGIEAGEWSVAIGLSSKAKNHAIAMGYSSEASAVDSVAFGNNASAKGLGAIAIGGNYDRPNEGAQAYSEDTIAIGRGSVAGNKDDTATAYNSVAVGREARAYGKNSIALGGTANVGDIWQKQLADGGTAIGSSSNAALENATAIGYKSIAYGKDAVTLGANTRTDIDGAVALGSDSQATVEAGVYGYDPYKEGRKQESPTWKSTKAAVSVGKDVYDYNLKKQVTETRQITNVAAGTKSTDAVNVAQLKNLQYRAADDLEAAEKRLKQGIQKNAGDISNLSTKVAGNTSNINYLKNQRDKDFKFLNEAIEGHTTRFVSVNRENTNKTIPNYRNEGATKLGSIAIGVNTGAVGEKATTLGYNSYARGEGSVIIGETSTHMSSATKPIKDGQFEQSIIVGSQNEIYALEKDLGGREDTILGSKNEITESHGTFVRGVGNTVYDAYNDEVMTADEKKQLEGYLRKDEDAPESPIGLFEKERSHVTVDGDGNSVAGAIYTRVSGVSNDLSNSDGKSRISYNIVTGNRNTVIDSSNNLIMGDNHELKDVKGNIIIGSLTTKAKTEASNVTILGNDANVSVEGGVALGTGSVASTAAEVAGYDPLTGEASAKTTSTWKSGNGAVSVGTTDKTRQITNLAAGLADTDAVNVAQLKNSKTAVEAGDYVTVTKKTEDGKGTTYTVKGPKLTAEDNLTVTDDVENNKKIGYKVKLNKDLKGLTSVTSDAFKVGDKTYINSQGINANNNKITNVAAGAADGDAVNFKQLSDVKTKVEANEGNITTNKNAIADLTPKVTTNTANIGKLQNGFTVKDGGTGSANVTLGGDKKQEVTFKAAVDKTTQATADTKSLSSSVDADRNVTYTLNMSQLKKDLGITEGTDGVMSSWKLKATGGDTTEQDIKNGEAVTFDVAAADKGLTVARDGKTIKYGIEGSKIDIANNQSITNLGKRIDNLPSIHYFSVKSDDSANPDGTNYKNDGATGKNAIAIGKDAKAERESSVVVGLNASSGDAANDGVAVGSRASVTGFGGVAIGRESSAEGQETVAIGTGAKGAIHRTVAIGGYANADGFGAVAIGRDSSSKERGVALGNRSFSHAYSVGVGEKAIAEAPYSVAVGDLTGSYAMGAVTLGNKTRAFGDSSVAIGNQARVSGKGITPEEYKALSEADQKLYRLYEAVYHNYDDPSKPIVDRKYYKVIDAHDWRAENHYNSIAIGTTSFVEAKEAIGIGAGTRINGDRGVALGYAAVSEEKGTALGAGAQAKANAGVALGEGAVADTAAEVAGYDPKTGKVSTETTPTWKSVKGAVSVGTADATRQITNLAAGSADTDAVNVAQLKALEGKVTGNAGDITTLQKGWTLEDGNTTKGTKTVKAEDTVKVTGDDYIKATVNNEGLALSMDETKLNDQINKQIDNSATVKAKMNSWVLKATSDKDEEKNGKTINNTDNAVTFDATGAGLTVTRDGSTIKYGIDGSTIDISENKTVADLKTDIKNSKTTVTGDEDGSGVKVENVAKTGEPANYKVSLGDKVKAGDVTVDGTKGAGQITGLSNTKWDADKIVSGRAATEDQLKAVSENAAEAAKKHTTVVAGDYVTVSEDTNANGGKEYTVNGPKVEAAQGETNLVVGDIKEGDKKVGYNLSLNKELKGLTSVSSDTFKSGDNVTINKDGLTIKIKDGSSIKDGPSVTTKGIDAGKKKITNVADGDVSENSTDAVNGGQLYKLQQTVAGNKVTVEAAKNSQITVTPETQADKSTKYVVDIAKDGTIGGAKDGNLVTGDTVKKYVDANKVTVTGDEDGSGVKVENVAKTGEPANYKVSLGDKIKAGDVTVDGTKGAGQITGLSNTKWDADKIVSGRAATEDQLKAVSENAAEAAKKHTTVVAGDYVTVSEGTNANGGKEYTVTGPKVAVAKDEKNLVVGDIMDGNKKVGYELKLNKELTGLTSVSSTTFKAGDNVTINNEGLTIKKGPSVTAAGIDAGKKKITNVAAGDVSEKSTEAVNGGQLFGVEQKVNINNRNISILGGKVSELNTRVNRVGAGAAALAALHPLDFDPDDKWDFAAGYGNYKGANAAAIGAYYRPNEDTMVSVGGSFGGGENMVNAGVSVKLGQGNHVTTSRVAMAKEIKDLRAEVEVLRQAVTGIGQGQTPDPVKMKLFPDIAKNHWAYEAVEELTKQGLLEGYPDGTFGGDRMMTRYEFAEIVYRAMQKGLNVNEKLIQEFEPELERFRIDVISKDKDGNPVIERVRVNEKKKAK